MPYPFPKDDSFEGSSDSLIEHVPRLKKRASRRCHWSLLRICVVSVAVAVAIIEMVVLETIFVFLTSHEEAPQLLSELNKLVPEFAVRQVLFRKDAAATWDHQSEESRNATRDDWLSYFPRGNGFVAVNDSGRYTLPDPILFRGQDAYSIAVFHQLHCLYTIMDVYNDMSSSAGIIDEIPEVMIMITAMLTKRTMKKTCTATTTWITASGIYASPSSAAEIRL